WSRNRNTNFQAMDDFGGAVVLPESTLHPAFAPPRSSFQINLGAAGVLYAAGPNSENLQRQVNIVDSLLVARGRHQIKVGVDLRRRSPGSGPLQYVQSYNSGGVAGIWAGPASSIALAATSTANHSSHSTNVSTFAQDTWSATPALTLTYGVRWEINPPPG